jgi:hypothetical protein
MIGERNMGTRDEIVAEVRAAREAYAARFNYDLPKMHDDLKAKEQTRANLAKLRPLNPQLNTPSSGPGTALDPSIDVKASSFALFLRR